MPRNPPPPSFTADEAREGRPHGVVRALIWTYFALIILEGPLRKWILPGLANQLILVRDPVLILIYATAIVGHVFRYHWTTVVLAVVALFSVLTAVIAGHGDLRVALYGMDANFLHLPLIFIIGEVMKMSDVVKLGRSLLILTVPTALLMAIQFRADPNDFVNVGPGGAVGSQIESAMGKIRPPGLFTFVTGAAMFLTVASAFVIYGFLHGKVYNRLFLSLCSMCLIISTVVSSSRLVIGGIGVVFLMIAVIGLYNRDVIRGTLSMLIPLGVAFFVAASLDIFQEGQMVFEARLDNTGDSSRNIVQTASTWSERVFGGFLAGFEALEGTPMEGRGVGYGTNVGARLLTGTAHFTADEREWGRVVIELGPILAVPYLIVRVAIFFLLFKVAAGSARAGNYLPMLLVGSCGLSVLNGQFGVASTLAFTVFQAGLCLAASRIEHRDPELTPEPRPVNARVKIRRGRSIYAEALHSAPRNPEA